MRHRLSRPPVVFPRRRLPIPLLVFSVLILLPFAPPMAADPLPDAAEPFDVATDTLLPRQFGKVIFAKNSQASNQIYIIGQNHRSAVTGANGDKTLQAQMEIYRIGEWLIRQRQVDLLLPEGYFGDCSRTGGARGLDNASVTCERRLPGNFDEQRLRERLADTSTFVNAATLLNARYGVPLGQVEDEALYRDVAGAFRHLESREEGAEANLLARLNCYQEQRTAAMLQNIPAVVEREHQDGHIQSKQAIFIIGMAHVAEVIRFLEREIIELFSPTGEPVQPEPCAVALLEQDYGVTVILPRTLAEDSRVMRLTRLAEFLGE